MKIKKKKNKKDRYNKREAKKRIQKYKRRNGNEI